MTLFIVFLYFVGAYLGGKIGLLKARLVYSMNGVSIQITIKTR